MCRRKSVEEREEAGEERMKGIGFQRYGRDTADIPVREKEKFNAFIFPTVGDLR